MTREDSAAENLRQEEELASSSLILMMTAGLTGDAGSFLIGAGAVLLAGVLYPLVGAWSFLAFPIIFIAVLMARLKQTRLRRRRSTVECRVDRNYSG